MISINRSVWSVLAINWNLFVTFKENYTYKRKPGLSHVCWENLWFSLKDPFVLLLYEITNVRTFTTTLAQYHITPRDNKNQILWNKGIKCLKIFKAALKTQITISISTSVKSFFKDSWHLNFPFLFWKDIPYQLLSIQLRWCNDFL